MGAMESVKKRSKIDYDDPGRFMFHAHVQEFTDLGWMGLFDVREEVQRVVIRNLEIYIKL